ncbi:MAG: S6e family ribosomal protein [Promethearchaeota archaeon]
MSEGITYRINVSKGPISMQFTVEPEIFMKVLVGKKIGDEIDGAFFGYPGYVFEIRGGSDIAGFPMRRDVHGGVKKRIYVRKPGVGVRKNRLRKGDRIRVLVRGNTITDQIVQVNCTIVKEGKVKLFVDNKDDSESGKD